MKLKRTMCLAFAGVVIMIAFYFASARMGALAAGPSIDRLATHSLGGMRHGQETTGLSGKPVK